MKYIIFTIVVVFVTKNLIAAEIYKCEDGDGNVSFQSRPCKTGENQSEVDVFVNDSIPSDAGSSDSEFIISKSQLSGTWTDVYPRSALSSTWTFSGSTLVFRRYSGKTVRADYTLEKDRIVIHHKKGAFSEEDWDDVYEIKKYENGELVVENITRMNWKKL